MALYKLLVASLLVSFVILHLVDADDQLIAMEHALRDAANHLGRTSATGHVELAADAATACRRELLVTKKCVPAITIKPPTEADASALKLNS
ncbi:hypothetical protein P8452_23950 [Trifolium repens]|nr:hypothetical protein P8452_23950 [Trifolium repens]